MTLAAHPWLQSPRPPDAPVALAVHFTSDRFPSGPPTDPQANAGNAQPGQALAEALAEALASWGLTAIDEDWGWLVTGPRSLEAPCPMLCVYLDGEAGGAAGHWRLHLLSEARQKWLGLIPYWKAGPYDPSLASDLVRLLEGWGVAALQLGDAERL